MPQLSRNTWIAIAVALPVLGYLGFRWYEARKASEAAASSTGQTVGDTSSPVPAGTTAANSGVGGGTFAPPTVGGNAFSGNTWTDPNTGDTWYEISGAVAGAGTGSLVGVWIDGTTGATQYGTPPFTQTSVGPTTTATPPAQTPPSTTPPAQTPLPSINAQSYPTKVLFGQYAPGDYTQIGSVQNGQFQGTNVTGGVPVYANLFGGFVQDFNMATLPNGTGIYIPTSLVQYEQQAA